MKQLKTITLVGLAMTALTALAGAPSFGDHTGARRSRTD
jgi:hypothetical protein